MGKIQAVALGLSLLLGTLSACSDGSSDEELLSPASPSRNEAANPPSGSSSSSSSGGSNVADGGVATPDAAVDPKPDAGGNTVTDGGSTASDPFAGAGAFVSVTGPRTHNAGRNCMSSCHNHGFSFAGTVTDGAGNGVAGAEVRLVDTSGKSTLVHTGSNGNFYSFSVWTGSAIVGVRTATQKAVMVTSLKSSDGGCNGCHATGGTTSPIHVP